MKEVLFNHIFGNIFDDVRITTPRLTNFAEDAHSRLLSQNTNQEYDAQIAQLRVAIDELTTKISKVDVDLAIQYGDTLTVDRLIADFKQVMQEKEGVIADALGGFDSVGYIEFYPKGEVEYNQATKEKLPVLINRVAVLAQNYTVQLPPSLTTTLLAMATHWELYRNKQQKQKGAVSEGRYDRSEKRKTLEIVLHQLMHFIAQKFPTNSHHCSIFFDVHLLYATGHKKGSKKKEY